MLYGLSDEDNDSGLQLEERKRKRGDPDKTGVMDVDGGSNFTGSQGIVTKEAAIFVGDFAASKQLISAKLAEQASRL